MNSKYYQSVKNILTRQPMTNETEPELITIPEGKFTMGTISDSREISTLKTRRIGQEISYSHGEVYCRAAFRFADPPTDRYSAQGFRVVLGPDLKT